ncbi:MAG TPA: ABC transporter permease subunit, partial [Alphaproteobacteria bacterium]|nr:ABC transporter permease subunit [Alphaproteobacteria bacterium]
MAFLRVTLPLSLPGVIAASLLVFIPTVGDFVTPSLVGGTTGIMVGNVIQSLFEGQANWPMGAALSFISMFVITLVVCVFLWGTKRVRGGVG